MSKINFGGVGEEVITKEEFPLSKSQRNFSGIMEAQYELLRKKGHSPSEAFNETNEN